MRKVRNLFFIVCVCLIGYVGYVAYGIYTYSEIDEKRQAEVAVVLGAGVDGEEPSPVFRERIEHGIWLYEEGYVKKILFTGGKGDGAGDSESGVAREYAIGQGVPAEDILIEEKSEITQENIYYGKKILEEKRLDTVILVSDPLHMKRAMLMARDHGLDVYSSPTPTTRYRTMKTKVPFLARETFFYIGYVVLGDFYKY